MAVSVHCTATAIRFCSPSHGSPKIALAAGMLHLQRAQPTLSLIAQVAMLRQHQDTVLHTSVCPHKVSGLWTQKILHGTSDFSRYQLSTHCSHHAVNPAQVPGVNSQVHSCI
eukprot:COSAG01_NODE_2652_length_7308_cov_3.492995_7_plen_112_part_00